ncbi:MAG: hypothetical protein M3P12_09270 [Gemmatimonadota bacterium]|nr:hypothetical protein [Gemmatimonadota bacterium]
MPPSGAKNGHIGRDASLPSKPAETIELLTANAGTPSKRRIESSFDLHACHAARRRR